MQNIKFKIHDNSGKLFHTSSVVAYQDGNKIGHISGAYRQLILEDSHLHLNNLAPAVHLYNSEAQRILKQLKLFTKKLVAKDETIQITIEQYSDFILREVN